MTTYRRRAIDAGILARFREIAAQRCVEWGGELLELNGKTDHVHLLVSLPPELDLSRFVNNLKTTTSRLIRRDFPDRMRKFYRKPVLWSRSYCIVSCGGAPIEIIRRYIEQQATIE